MARTKGAARRGEAGHDFRENQKRKRELAEGASRDKGNFPSIFQEQDRPSKKSRATPTVAKLSSHQSPSVAPDAQDRVQNDASSSAPVTTAPAKLGGQRQIPAPHDLTHTHRTTELSILSSSQIQKKASRILSILSTFSFSDPAPHVVLLSAKAPVAGKLITIAEIAKRELAKTGAKLFQYNVVGELTATIPSNTAEAEKTADEKDGDTEMKDGGDEEEEEAFETMKTPFERALEAENRPKIRAVPTFTLYLSRVRIESLKKMYGEQTNALT
ncbi:hypothetical protein BELL_0999g00020 [Botrytis elliptica]|uniref:DNA/RNA-binding protein Alba-like domain-containing protein n=1 Tax=Botrytis elliptica TaxID=278938 RepID=A0A4Z1IW13_9HELO|nr:hypothetical protein BELL_0999g00020 [Botrytis elliptica]